MSVSRWDPFQDLLAIQDEMNQVFGRARQGQGGRVWAPALDISERKDAYVVTVEVPGVKADDLDITLEDGLLTIQGERQFAHDSSEQQFHRVERRYGAFRRSITLPAHVMADGIQASADNGVLQILVPKMEEATPKRIQVRTGRATIPAASSEDTTPS
jgi:HSP20 family protein